MHIYNAHCPRGTSSAVATYFFESREFAIKALFSDEHENGVFLAEHCILLMIVTYVLTLMTYGCGIPAGLFIPNIMIGACFGRAVGILVKNVVADIDPSIHVNPGVYALIGSAAMLAGFTRMTMSLAVIVLEITTDMFMTLPIMMVITVAKAVGVLFTPSVYDIVVALKNVPLLEPEIETKGWQELDSLPLAVIGTDTQHLSVVEFKTFRVRDAVAKLTQSRHHAWPVVDSAKNMRLLGLLSRYKLINCLSEKGLLRHDDETLELENLKENTQELDIWKYVRLDPFVLLSRTSVLSGYRTFRMLGLRHLCVANEHHQIVAMVTRADFCEVVEEFVHDYKTALKDFAEDVSRFAAELDRRVAIQDAESEHRSLAAESGLPARDVQQPTRHELRQRRRDRITSGASGRSDSTVDEPLQWPRQRAKK